MWSILSAFQILAIALWTVATALWMIPAIFIGLIKFVMWGTGNIWSFGINWIAGVKVEVRNPENRHDHAPCIYVANHASHFDITALFYQSPVPLYFVAKKELRKVPFMGVVMSLTGMIFIDRGNRAKAMRSMQEAGRKIKAGKHVVTFPEGTRSATGEVGLFKRGSFIMALEGEVPVIPVAITGSRSILGKKSYTIRPGTITITFGEPMDPAAYDRSNPDAFANEARDRVIELMG